MITIVCFRVAQQHQLTASFIYSGDVQNQVQSSAVSARGELGRVLPRHGCSQDQHGLNHLGLTKDCLYLISLLSAHLVEGWAPAFHSFSKGKWALRYSR